MAYAVSVKEYLRFQDVKSKMWFYVSNELKDAMQMQWEMRVLAFQLSLSLSAHHMQAFVVVKIAPWPVLKSLIPDTFQFGMKSQSR